MPYGSVLVVDDVDVNLFVAKGFMKPYGLTVETALSGYEAIEKIRGGAVYDIVFMDHMMPGMDGIAATKLLREEGYMHPIVALTANALVGQEDVFLANGFDGFISKPIDSRQMNDVLIKLIRDKYPPKVIEEARRKEERGDVSTSPNNLEPAKGAAAELLNHAETLMLMKRIDGLDVDSALDAMNNMTDIYVDTANLTAQQLPEKIRNMDKYIDTDLKRFTVEVHGLKAVLRNLGANALGNQAAKFEKNALDDNKTYCDDYYPSFRIGLVNLADNLNIVFPSPSGCENEEAKISSLMQEIADVKAAAEIFNRDAALYIITPHIYSKYGEKMDVLVKEIFDALNVFKCEEALKNINRLELYYSEFAKSA